MDNRTDISILLEKKDIINQCIEILRDEILYYNRYPIRDYSTYGKSFRFKYLIFELSNMFRFYFNGNNMFNPSLLLSYYYNHKSQIFQYYNFMIKGNHLSKKDLPEKIVNNLDLFLSTGLISVEANTYKMNYRVINLFGLILLADMYSLKKNMVWLSSDSLATSRLFRTYVKRNQFFFSNRKKIKILDLCCGNAVIALSLNSLIPANNIQLFGLDINERAIEMAKLNCFLNRINHTKFYIKSLYDYEFNRNFDIIVSNPAYGSSSFEAKRLCHWSGETGIEQLVKIFEHIKNNLNTNGFFFVMSTSPVVNGKSLLLDHLQKYYTKVLNMTYEILETYNISTMNISSSNYKIRQKAIIYGNKNISGNGKINIITNKYFKWLNAF